MEPGSDQDHDAAMHGSTNHDATAMLGSSFVAVEADAKSRVLTDIAHDIGWLVREATAGFPEGHERR